MKAYWTLLILIVFILSGCNKELGPVTDIPLDNVLEYTELDNEFLKARFNRDFSENEFAIISHDTYMRHSTDKVSTLNWLDSEFQSDECEIMDMIEALFEKNKKPARLTLKSSKNDGFVYDDEVDYDEFPIFGTKHSRRLHEKFPDVKGSVRVSLPVIGKNGLVLIYYEYYCSWGVGRYELYQFKDKKLKYLTAVVAFTAS